MLDPDNFKAPSSGGPLRLAYVSAGEADASRSFWPSVSTQTFIVESNPDWRGSHRVDLRSPKWRSLILKTVIPEALNKGYKGVMFDTLDVAEYYESSAPARFAGSMRAAASLVTDLRARHPGIVILVNNALALLDRIGDAIDGVVVEDLYTRCPPDHEAPCGPTPAAVAAKKEKTLLRFVRKTGKPVFVLMYARLDQRRESWLMAALRRARRNGFHPYLASPDLQRLGSIDPAPR